MDASYARLTNVRRRGRVGGVPGTDWLEPGQSVELPLEVAKRYADDDSLRITEVIPARPTANLQAAEQPRRGGKFAKRTEPDDVPAGKPEVE